MKTTLLIILFIFLPSILLSQNISWERTNGPYGGFITVIYKSSSGKIFASGRGLLYRKDYNENNWTLVLRTNTSSTGTTIVENSQGEIFASFGIGTYSSSNNGDTWELMNSGVTGLLINKLTIDDEDNLYTSALISLTCKIFKSTDNGISWNEIYSYYPAYFDFYDIKAGKNGLILAGGTSPKLLRTINYGQTWNEINYSNLSSIYRILIVSNTEMFATETSKEIWKSIDNGQNWNVISLAPTNQQIRCIKKDTFGNLYLGLNENILYIGWAGYGGIYKSTNGGQSWEENLTYNMTNRQVLSIELLDDNKIWIGTNGKGVQELNTYDTTWYDVNSGMYDMNINSLAFDTTNNLWLCTSRGGIFYSSNYGNTWLERSKGLSPPSGYEMKVASDNSTFLADAYGIYKYDDNNNAWKEKLSPAGEGNDIITCVEIKDNDTLFVGSGNGGIAVSYDNGESWDWNPPLYFRTSKIKVLSDRTVIAAGYSVYRTLDNGISWQFFYSCGNCSEMDLAQTEEGYLLTTCNNTTTHNGYLYLSTDNGQTQVNLTENINNPYLSFIKYYNNDRIIIGTTEEGLFLTTDYGEQWYQLNDGLDNLSIRSLAMNDSGYIFAGTSEGLFRSKYPLVVPVELVSFRCVINDQVINLIWRTATEQNNHGFEIERSFDKKKWNTIGFVKGKGTTTEPQSYSFSENVTDLSNNKIFYRLKQVDFNGSFKYSDVVEVEIGPSTFSLEQNYPNPFNPSTKISWQSPVGSWQTLKIFDVLGNEVVALVNEYREAGKYETEFNAEKLPSGVYYYQLRAGDYVQTKKMLLLK
ncbi:MAG TPA: hypothetical protein DHV28_11565 [Ignavibacteriales bacterium]|nr:hypothetical protein [Ignavibacteriales bacterium]